jgi:hypothetical protein
MAYEKEDEDKTSLLLVYCPWQNALLCPNIRDGPA